MVRSYDPERPLPAEVLDRVLANALRAPSAGYAQGWDFVVLTEPAQREQFWAATTDPDHEPDGWLRRLRQAPCLIICCSDPGTYLRRYAEADKGWVDQDVARWPVPYWDTDTAGAALLMLLTAVDEQLGGLFFGVPPDRVDAVRAVFAIPADRRLVGVVALGYPAPGRRSPSLKRGRRGPGEVVHRGRFGQH